MQGEPRFLPFLNSITPMGDAMTRARTMGIDRRYLKAILLASLCLWVLFPSYASADSPGAARLPALAEALRVVQPITFCGDMVPLSRQKVREGLERELLLSLWNQPQVLLWLKRSRRYLPYIEQMLAEHDMPDDLKYVAIIESDLRPHAGSRKGAVGFWQFMKGTGRKYGLVITSDIDERRNFFASTEAALRHFRALHVLFGSWTLAAAAYNMGEAGLMAEILEQETRDYYHLYLPLETQHYIFRILSVKLILRDPAAYGFTLSDSDYYPPLTFDRVRVTCPQRMPLRIIARAAQTTFKTIKELNPEIRGYSLPRGEYSVLVPQGASRGFQVRYDHALKHLSTDGKKRIYIVKRGDNLSSIAEKFGIPLPLLIMWNRVDISRPIYPGDRLVIYPQNRS